MGIHSWTHLALLKMSSHRDEYDCTHQQCLFVDRKGNPAQFKTNARSTYYRHLRMINLHPCCNVDTRSFCEGGAGVRSWVDGPVRTRRSVGSDNMVKCQHQGCGASFSYWQSRSKHYRTVHQDSCEGDCSHCSKTQKRPTSSRRRTSSLTKDFESGSSASPPRKRARRKSREDEDDDSLDGSSDIDSPRFLKDERSVREQQEDLFASHGVPLPPQQALENFDQKLVQLFQGIKGYENPSLYRTLNHVFLRDAEFAVELLSMTVEQVFEKIENLQRAEST